MEDLSKLTRNVIDLLQVKSSVLKMLEIKERKGLTGLCESVLGQPLCKDEQIGLWSRRPLRESQIVYAALDAWICPHILSTLQLKAEEQNKAEEFNNYIENFNVVTFGSKNLKSSGINDTDASPIKVKKKKKKSGYTLQKSKERAAKFYEKKKMEQSDNKSNENET